ncbi:hypothetical protein SAMD00023353_0900250 [Rosellinia necatrix]|uniref:Uncharacterized protein n=1 Tax=Rosellinia necatrix TaxID=77044 RepID=A0A1S8A675_ROSNE|nr:hypothetical protein SAMD00023353_0900250 [Rosellinia necatrix]
MLKTAGSLSNSGTCLHYSQGKATKCVYNLFCVGSHGSQHSEELVPSSDPSSDEDMTTLTFREVARVRFDVDRRVIFGVSRPGQQAARRARDYAQNFGHDPSEPAADPNRGRSSETAAAANTTTATGGRVGRRSGPVSLWAAERELRRVRS